MLANRLLVYASPFLAFVVPMAGPRFFFLVCGRLLSVFTILFISAITSLLRRLFCRAYSAELWTSSPISLCLATLWVLLACSLAVFALLITRYPLLEKSSCPALAFRSAAHSHLTFLVSTGAPSPATAGFYARRWRYSSKCARLCRCPKYLRLLRSYGLISASICGEKKPSSFAIIGSGSWLYCCYNLGLNCGSKIF